MGSIFHPAQTKCMCTTRVMNSWRYLSGHWQRGDPSGYRSLWGSAAFRERQISCHETDRYGKRPEPCHRQDSGAGFRSNADWDYGFRCPRCHSPNNSYVCRRHQIFPNPIKFADRSYGEPASRAQTKRPTSICYDRIPAALPAPAEITLENSNGRSIELYEKNGTLTSILV